MILATVGQTEMQLQQIYQLLIYAVPLILAVLTAYVGLYYQVRRAISANRATIAANTQATNGKLDTLSRQVGEIHDATTPSTSAGAVNTGIGAGPTADSGGATVPPSVATVHPVDVQPPGGNQ